ncbi:MAG TPA: hypothetical protein VK742_20370 [Candidatus Sulfotelmatobacter sp.]|jgi:hypothetical protein|nr:hypothetical protein [Candidatus Sulfotelmatobacter sp.]
MKFNKWTLGLAAVAVMAYTTAARAQTGIVTTTNANGVPVTVTLSPAQIEAALGVPSAATASMPAFNTNGLDFTNVNYKVGTGMEYLPSGGVSSYIEGDADLWHTKIVDVGVAGNAALASSSSGFQSAAIDLELLKNFSNFQIAGQAGVGGRFEGTSGIYGEESAELNYNLAKGTGFSFLGAQSSSVFTYVFAKVSLQESEGTTAGKKIELDKCFYVGAGLAF